MLAPRLHSPRFVTRMSALALLDPRLCTRHAQDVESLALLDVHHTDLIDATGCEESLIEQVRRSSTKEYRCLLLRINYRNIAHGIFVDPCSSSNDGKSYDIKSATVSTVD